MRTYLPTICISLAACTFGAIGCQPVQQRTTEPMNDTPLAIDEAMQKRDFPKTEAMYPNGAVLAGPTWQTFESKPDMPYRANTLADSGIAVGNIFLTPYQMFRQPPGSKQTFPGAVIEPSYTAMPQVPESASQVSQSERTAPLSNNNATAAPAAKP